MNPEIISVSQYLDKLNATLKGERAKIIGEVNAVKFHQNGHVYFSLLDANDQSKIECVIWRSNYRLFGIELSDGLQVVISSAPNIYKPNGRISFPVDGIELVGSGALQLAYEKLKKKLENEGLFAGDRKRPLPAFPRRIGVITSKSGAVIHDFNTNLGKFGFEILFVDSKVEGQDAIKDLLSAIKTLKNKNLDVLVIMRGGGSLESFQAFNNETLVRAVADFPVPTITGIGHEKDAPLVSMVSDKNVSTPTAVAGLLNSTWSEALGEVRLSEEKIMRYFTSIFDKFRRAEETLFRAVDRIDDRISRIFENISMQSRELSRSFNSQIDDFSEFIKQSEKSILLGSPEKQLSRGYSIVRNKGKILRSVKDVSKDDRLDITVSDGIIGSKVI